MELKYVGKGFLPGIPARDLSKEEVEKLGGKDALIATGLYAEFPKKAPKKSSTHKSTSKGV